MGFSQYKSRRLYFANGDFLFKSPRLGVVNVANGTDRQNGGNVKDNGGLVKFDGGNVRHNSGIVKDNGGNVKNNDGLVMENGAVQPKKENSAQTGNVICLGRRAEYLYLNEVRYSK